MPGAQRLLALAPDRLALARGERREEIVERTVAAVFPMELLVGPLQEIARAERSPFRLRQKCDMCGRQLIRGG